MLYAKIIYIKNKLSIPEHYSRDSA